MHPTSNAAASVIPLILAPQISLLFEMSRTIASLARLQVADAKLAVDQQETAQSRFLFPRLASVDSRG